MTKYVMIATFYGFAAMLSGTLGHHALQALLDQTGLGNAFFKGQQYLWYGAIMLLLCITLQRSLSPKSLIWPIRLFSVGTAIFCSSLLLYSLTGLRTLSYITPCGGLMLFSAWIMLGVAAWQQRHILNHLPPS